jgi:molecular chaperone DnaK
VPELPDQNTDPASKTGTGLTAAMKKAAVGAPPIRVKPLDRGEDPSMSFNIDEPEPLSETGVQPAPAQAPSRTMQMEEPSPQVVALPRSGKALEFTVAMPGAPQRPPARPHTEIAPAEPPASAWEPPSIPARNVAQDGIVARTSPLLIDVTPLSLSVETVGGFCDTLIPANSPVPCDRTRVFITAADQQTLVCVNVAQGSLASSARTRSSASSSSRASLRARGATSRFP